MSETHTLQATDTLPEDKAVTGRPSTFNDATAYIICERIAGGETLSAICKTPGMPQRQTVYKWRRKFSTFDVNYRLAREDQMEAWSDEIVAISDDDTLDTLKTVDKKGNAVEIPNHANVQRDRLRVSTRQFLMAKLNGRYADKVEHNVSGEVKHTHDLSDRERMRRLALFFMEDEKAGTLIEGKATEPATQQADSPDNP